MKFLKSGIFGGFEPKNVLLEHIDNKDDAQAVDSNFEHSYQRIEQFFSHQKKKYHEFGRLGSYCCQIKNESFLQIKVKSNVKAETN